MTGYFPHHLLYGKEIKMPIDQFVKYWKVKEVECEVDVGEYIQTLRENVEIVRDMARENEEEQKGLQKKYYDRKATERKFSFGDFVLLFRPRKRYKVLNLWRGPLTITMQITGATYQVDTRKRGRPLKLTILMLRNAGLLQHQ